MGLIRFKGTIRILERRFENMSFELTDAAKKNVVEVFESQQANN